MALDSSIHDKHKAIFIGLDIFRPDCLQSDDDVDAAVDVLEGTIDPNNVAAIIAHSLDKDLVLEFTLSGT